jgi:glycopeptide antibiotics resistance protein
VYLGDVQIFLPYTGVMLGIVIINWFIPVLHCIIRYIFDYNTRVDDFYIFYRNISFIFLVFYLGLLLYASFAHNVFEWAYPIESTSFNLLPFETIAALIEDYLYGLTSLSNIISYLLSRILIFVPYGFYIRLVLYRQTRIKRLIAIFILPFIIELMQYIIIPLRCDIDDIIYAAVGSVIGSLTFFLFNFIVRAITGRDFLIKNNDYHFTHSSLHF